MSHAYIAVPANINICPIVDETALAENGAIITMGDLHANALKFIYILKKHGVLAISEEQYEIINAIYHTPAKKLNQQDIRVFNDIIENAYIYDAAKNSILYLLGDEFTDRGMNDYFVLKIFQKLHCHNIPLEICISNHSALFIADYEKNRDFTAQLGAEFSISAENLQILIDAGYVSRAEVDHIIENCYIPKLRAINYSLNETQDRITIYSHAGIGINNIANIAADLNIDYDMDNLDAQYIAQKIEEINAHFIQHYVNQNKITQFIKISGKDAYHIDAKTFPIEHLICNRYYDDLIRPGCINFVHAHDSHDIKSEHIISLDNQLGKHLDLHTAEYTALYSMETKWNPTQIVSDTYTSDNFDFAEPQPFQATLDSDEADVIEILIDLLSKFSLEDNHLPVPFQPTHKTLFTTHKRKLADLNNPSIISGQRKMGYFDHIEAEDESFYLKRVKK